MLSWIPQVCWGNKYNNLVSKKYWHVFYDDFSGAVYITLCSIIFICKYFNKTVYTNENKNRKETFYR